MKKWFSVLLAVCLLLSIQAGALADVIDHTAYSQFPLVKEGETAPVITVAHIRDATYGMDPDKQWIWNWAEYATGLKFDVRQIMSNAKADQIPLMFASNDVPDLLWGLQLTTTDIARYGMAEHQFKDLTDWITEERMPYLSAWFEAYPDSKALITTPDGAIYSLPGYQNIKRSVGSQQNALINMEWLAETGMDVPTTLDDMVKMLYAFKEKHPDSTPIAEVVPTDGNGTTVLNVFLNAYGFLGNCNEYGFQVAIKDGKAVLPCGHKDFAEFLKLMHQFYEDGIIMKDYFTADSLAKDTLKTEHKTGFTSSVYAALPDPAEFQKWENFIPLTSQWNETPQWKGTNPYKVGSALIGAKITDEKLDLVLRFLDFFYSDLGAAYLWDGPLAGSADTLGMVKGWVYNHETDVREFLDVLDGKYSSGTEYVKGIIGTNATTMGNRSHSLEYPDVLTYFYEIAQYLQDRDLSKVKSYAWTPEHGDGWQRLTFAKNVLPYLQTGFPDIVFYDEETLEEIDEILMLLKNHVMSNVAKFITGDRDLSEFDQFVSECEGLGLRDLEAIYQNAYDAFLANE